MIRTTPMLLLLAELIREARSAQNRAMAAGDVERSVSFWTDDVSLRRGLGHLVKGKAEYRRLLVPAGNRDSMIGGRYSAQWVKRAGRWLIRAEVFVRFRTIIRCARFSLAQAGRTNSLGEGVEPTLMTRS